MKNKNIITGVIFLFIGLAIGGAAVWLLSEERPDEKTAEKTVRKILFYRNPMDPEVTSPVPMKDQMGMDYVPVYEGDAEPAGNNAINIGVEKIQKLGVKSEAAPADVAPVG